MIDARRSRITASGARARAKHFLPSASMRSRTSWISWGCAPKNARLLASLPRPAKPLLRKSGAIPTTTPTMRFEFGDVVLVPFPFTSQTALKKRPAVVVSSRAYNASRLDVVVMAVTSQVRANAASDEVWVQSWKAAGLVKPSVIKPGLRDYRAIRRYPSSWCTRPDRQGSAARRHCAHSGIMIKR